MPRSGPLKELPLEQFLPLNPNFPSRKRPLSPGGPNLFSPAKRRILNEEGIFSPEKTLKSPLGRVTPARFTQVLMGPSSPARRLDFGSPKSSVESPTTPRRATVEAKKLAPSPELERTRVLSSSQPTEDQVMEEYFSQPSSSSSLLPPSSSTSSIVPRENPPPPDPQSIHYPGFIVYFDGQTTMFSVEDVVHSLPNDVKDKEEIKENVVPRRKPRKAVTAPDTDIKSQLLSPHTRQREIEKTNRAKSTPATPKKTHLSGRCEPSGSPTPQRPVTRRDLSTT